MLATHPGAQAPARRGHGLAEGPATPTVRRGRAAEAAMTRRPEPEARIRLRADDGVRVPKGDWQTGWTAMG